MPGLAPFFIVEFKNVNLLKNIPFAIILNIKINRAAFLGFKNMKGGWDYGE